MYRRPRFSFLVLGLCVALGGSAGAQEGFVWQFDGELATELGYGTLSRVASTAPQELGEDGVLAASELEVVGDNFAPQLSFHNRLEAELLLRWRLEGVSIEALFSVIAMQAPFGYWPEVGAAIAPGELGLRLDWPRSEWDSWGFVVHGGRHRIVDPSGLLLDQLVDGLAFEAGTETLYFSLGAGFTALLDKYFYTPRLAVQDGSQYDDTSQYFPPNRLIGQLSGHILLPGEQRLALSAIVYEDLLPDQEDTYLWTALTGQGPVVRFGPVVQQVPGDPDQPLSPLTPEGSLSHETTVAFQWNFTGAPVAFLLANRLTLMIPQFPLNLSLDTRFATGGVAGEGFQQVTSQPQGDLIAVPLSNLVRLAFDARFLLGAPTARFDPVVRSVLFLVPVPDSGNPVFLGTENTAGIELDLLSDLWIGARAGMAFSASGLTPLLFVEGRVRI